MVFNLKCGCVIYIDVTETPDGPTVDFDSIDYCQTHSDKTDQIGKVQITLNNMQ